MGIGGIQNGANVVTSPENRLKKRVIGSQFNNLSIDKNNGIKKNEPLMCFTNSITKECIEISRSDVYSEELPLYEIKGIDLSGKQFEKNLHAWTIDPYNCSYMELMILNAETGNDSISDKQRVDKIFEKIGLTSCLEKANYSSVAKEILDNYQKSGNWDDYLKMDKWKNSIDAYTSIPVYFDRTFLEGNDIRNCSFGTVRTAEEIQKEINDRIKAGEKDYPSLRKVLASTYPNAEKLMYRAVDSSRLMDFDEYVKWTEKMLQDVWKKNS